MVKIYSLPFIEEKALAEHKDTRNAALITGERSWAAVEDKLELNIQLKTHPHSADLNALNNLARGLGRQVEVVYGVGGGQVADVAKYVAAKNDLPCVIVPTTLSVDGFFTPVVAARDNKTMHYQETGPVSHVIIDLDVISQAPRHLRGAGIVELLSMTTGLLDWEYADKRTLNRASETYQLWAAQVAASIAMQAYKIARGVGNGNKTALRQLLDLMCVEVQLTNQLGHNRPQEGSEQYFAYAIEQRINAEDYTYADVLGPGILIAAALHKKDVSAIRQTLLAAGVRLDELPRQTMIQTLVDSAELCARAQPVPQHPARHTARLCAG